MKNNQSSKIVSSIALMFFTILTFFVVVFAWFTNTMEVRVEGIWLNTTSKNIRIIESFTINRFFPDPDPSIQGLGEFNPFVPEQNINTNVFIVAQLELIDITQVIIRLVPNNRNLTAKEIPLTEVMSHQLYIGDSIQIGVMQSDVIYDTLNSIFANTTLYPLNTNHSLQNNIFGPQVFASNLPRFVWFIINIDYYFPKVSHFIATPQNPGGITPDNLEEWLFIQNFSIQLIGG